MPYGWELTTEVDADNPVEGDLRVVNRKLARLSEFGDSVAQSVRVHFREWRGEWFLNRKRGMPYLEQLLGKGIGVGTIRAVFRREALRVHGVASVPKIEVTRDPVTRRSAVDMIVITTEGESVSIADLTVGGGT